MGQPKALPYTYLFSEFLQLWAWQDVETPRWDLLSRLRQELQARPLGLLTGVKRSPKLWQLPCRLMGRSRDPNDMTPDIGEQQDSHPQFSIFKLLPI